MAKTQTTCPRCKQPIVVDLQQVFDLNVDPQAKQSLLGGSVNVAHCPSCGYSGPAATPIVYHDPEKELLLTFFPPELGMAVNEQEKLLGPMINQVANKLANEKKKAYLLQPKTMLTFQTMIETILQADGITKEMLDEQQKKLSLLQRLLAAKLDSRSAIIEQEKSLIDQTFFTMLSRLLEISMSQGDQASATALNDLQKELMEKTEIGKQIKTQAEEVESILKALQEAGKDGLTREKLLDLLINAKSDLQISTIVGLARAGLDYVFFQDLTSRIDSSQGEEQRKFLELRQKLLQMTKAIDEKIDTELKRARQTLEKMISAENVEKAVEENLREVDDFFAQVLKTAIEDAHQRNDQERTGKLQNVVEVIEKASAPPPEVALIEELLSAPDDTALQALLEKNADKFSSQFFQYLNSIAIQGTGKQSEEVKKKLDKVYGAVTKFSMQQNLKK